VIHPPRQITARFAESLVSTLAVFAGIVVVLPVVSIALIAMQPVGDLWPHLAAYVLPNALLETALLLAGVGLVSLALGVGAAWTISSYDFPGRGWLIWLMPLPLAIPTYIGAYVYVEIFEPLGLAYNALSAWMPAAQAAALLPQTRSLPGAVLMMGIVLYPYVYLSARAMFQTQSADFAEAARQLGASKWQVFFRVALPMARPALAVGVALVLLETLNDIGASEYLGIRTLTVAVFTTWLNRGSLAGAAQISCLMLVVVVALVLLERHGRKARTFAASAENPRLAERISLRGAQGWTAAVLCALPPLFGFVIPLLFLMRESIHRTAMQGVDPAVYQAAAHSILLALIATAIVLALGLSINLAQRLRSTPIRAASLVLALGLLTPMVMVDNTINAIARGLGLSAPGLLLAGSSAAVVVAYVIRFMAVASGLINAGFERIPRDYDDSAKVDGASAWICVRRIYLPLLRPALWGAAILVFVDCLKELPATLLLRPLNVETLSTSIYQYASRGSFEDGSLAALIIVAASIGPVVWLTRFSDMPSGPA
jgi:iron(III) transport system permease protein